MWAESDIVYNHHQSNGKSINLSKIIIMHFHVFLFLSFKKKLLDQHLQHYVNFICDVIPSRFIKISKNV